MPLVRNTFATRQNVARRVLADTAAHWPSIAVQRMRKEERRLQSDFDLAATPKERSELSAALCRLRALIAEFSGMPRRPGWKPNKARTITDDGTMLIADAQPAADGLNSGTQVAETGGLAGDPGSKAYDSKACARPAEPEPESEPDFPDVVDPD